MVLVGCSELREEEGAEKKKLEGEHIGHVRSTWEIKG